MNRILHIGLLAKRSLLICITLIALFIDSSVGQQVAYAQLLQPYLVKDINTRTLSSDPFGFTGVNGLIYFAADDGVHGSELWRTDGTVAGTWLVKDLVPGWQGASPEQIQADQQGNLYFLTRFPGSNTRGLWKSDGTTAGTQEVLRGNMGWVTVLGEHAYFAQFTQETGEELWTTDGTGAGTKLLKDINPGPGGSGSYCTLRFQARLYCYANDGVHGNELWRTDGTTTGTQLVKDIDPSNGMVHASQSTPESSAPALPLARDTASTQNGEQALGSDAIRPFAILGNLFYFSAYTPSYGWELWQSDGTAAGTELAKDLVSGPESASPRGFLATPHFVYFTVDQKTGPDEVWRTDGTNEGTYKLADGRTDEAAAVGDTLFFNNCCATGDSELWQSDGTPAGTHLVKDIHPGPEPSAPKEMVAFGNKVYFFAQDGQHGDELWVSDGTTEGTQLLKDLLPGPASPTPNIGVTGHELVVIDRMLYFRAIDPDTGHELWKSDGTAVGTGIVKDIHSSHNESSVISDMTSVGDVLYFVATGNQASALWKTNTTATDVEPVLSLDQTEGVVSNLAVMSNTLYLLTRTTTDLALVRITGTQTTTIPLQPAPSTHIKAYVYPLVVVGNRLFFNIVYNQLNAAGEVVEQEGVLWVSDGSSRGTQIVKRMLPSGNIGQDLVAFQNQLYFIAAASADPNQLALWRSDGTGAGTLEVKGISLVEFVTAPLYFAVAGEQLFFLGVTESGDKFALWRSDGTSDGTYIVTPLQITDCPNFNGFLVYQDELYFCNDDDEHGAELWKSDGTAAGTRLVKDINPGSASARPQLLFADKTHLFFKATDGAHSSELWQSAGSSESTHLFLELTQGQQSIDISGATFWHNQLYFTANQATIPAERYMLWQSNGTAAGTRALIQLSFDSNRAALIQTTANTLFFGGYTPATGEELWAINAAFSQYSFLPMVAK